LHQAFADGMAAIRAAERHITSQKAGWHRKVSKREHDFVTDLDLEVERVMRSVLNDSNHIGANLVGEEFGGSRDLGSGRYWVMDPIDGTTNVLRKIPSFTVTLALVVDGRPVIGIVSAPMLKERYSAVVGEGAWVEAGEERTPLHTSGVTDLAGSLVSINDIYSLSDTGDRRRAGRITGALAVRTLQIRCHGSIGLDMAWVAAGRLEACVAFSNRPWDVLAGALLVQEAGGCVFDDEGRPHALSSSEAIGSSRLVRDELVALLEAARLG
jgi:myo-inositol-1(or 4)-monophosphatase